MSGRVFITAAEISGDRHAAQLIRRLREMDPDLVIEGHGGPAMRAAGAVIYQDLVANAAMGLRAAFRALEVRRTLAWTRQHFSEHPPDLQICVDSWSLNCNFAKLAHDRGAKVLYYIAPQVWASRPGRVRRMRKWVDRVACIHLFEEEYFRRRDVAATFVGHPLFDELPAKRNEPTEPRFPDRPPVIGLLPGSRRAVAKDNFPSMLDVARRIRAEFPGATFLVPTTTATHSVVEDAAAGQKDIPIEIKLDGFDELVPRCDLCVTVSGTATLHVAGHGVPMIVVYRANPILWHLIGRWIIKTRTYSLVNLLSDSHEHIVPEFVPWYGSNAPVAETAVDYLRHPEKLTRQRACLHEVIRELDKPGALRNAAQIAMEMLKSK